MSEARVVIVRAIIGFFSLLIFARILGKQQISQLTFFEYALGITIGSNAATLTTDLSSRAWPHWVGMFTWALLGYLLEVITLKWRYAAKYISGEPTIVIMNGKIMERTLRKMKYRISDIMELLRNKDVFDLNEVEYAIIEPNGELSVLKKNMHIPVTRGDLHVKTKGSGISTELIYDGILIEQNLQDMNKDKQWLKSMLKSYGIREIEEVFLATLDPQGNIYIDKYKDHLDHITDISDYKGPY